MPPMAAASSIRPALSDVSAIDTVLVPGEVRINAQGAFIVADESRETGIDLEDGATHDIDIRLPNHSGVVSHVALDVILTLSIKILELMLLADRRLAHQACILLMRV